MPRPISFCSLQMASLMKKLVSNAAEELLGGAAAEELAEGRKFMAYLTDIGWMVLTLVKPRGDLESSIK